jgi:hypothetical protein
MTTLPETVTDAELIAFVDRWASLLEREDYAAAHALAPPDGGSRWTPERIRWAVEGTGRRVTVAGESRDFAQRKEVDRWEDPGTGEVGEVWYDLNIDGVVSDLTARFRVVRVPDGVAVRLHDIRVM